jgi:hypothetical protein
MADAWVKTLDVDDASQEDKVELSRFLTDKQDAKSTIDSLLESYDGDVQGLSGLILLGAEQALDAQDKLVDLVEALAEEDPEGFEQFGWEVREHWNCLFSPNFRPKSHLITGFSY